jgi:hypothetical protein
MSDPATRTSRAAVALPLLALLATLATLASLATSCARPLELGREVDPLSLLSPDALVYLSLGKLPLVALGEELLKPEEAKALAPLIEGTNRAALAILPGGAGFETALLGSYPFRGAGLALAGKKEWGRLPRTAGPAIAAYRNGISGLEVALPGPGLVLASSSSVAPLIAALATPRPSPLPPELAAYERSEILLWAPDPFARLGEALLQEAIDIPSKGLLIAATRLEGSPPDERDPIYEATVIFLMKSQDDARIFRPAARIAWYGFASFLSPGDSASVRFETRELAISATGIRLRSSELFAALKALAVKR